MAKNTQKVEKDSDREGCYIVDGVPQCEGWEPTKKSKG